MYLPNPLEYRITNRKKMDLMFYNSIKVASSNYFKKFGLHMFKLILLIVFLVIDIKILHTEQWKILILMKLGIACCIVNALVNLFIVQLGFQDN